MPSEKFQCLTRRNFIKSLAGCAVALGLPVVASAQAPLANKVTSSPASAAAGGPNVIIIFADDLGIGDVSAYFAKKIQTPNIDRMGSEGIRFTDAHVTTAWCAPSRFSLLTGTYPWRQPGHEPNLHASQRYTLDMLFRDAGYQTAMFGKWHLGWKTKPASPDGKRHIWPRQVEGGALEAGFTHSVILPWGHQFPPCQFIVNGEFRDYDPADPPVAVPNPDYVRERDWAEPLAAAWKLESGQRFEIPYREVAPRLQHEVLDYLGAHHDQPFFIYYAVAPIHAPFAPSQPYIGKTEIGAYGDFVAELDAFVGQLNDRLIEHHLFENTLVIFTSDNGGIPEQILPPEAKGIHKPNGPYRGAKGSAYEGGHRVPFLATWPARIKPGTVCTEFISCVDLMATCAAILGATIPPGEARDSHDVSAAFFGQPVADSDRTYTYESTRQVLAVRKGRWKYIDAPDGGGYFDQQPDPKNTIGQLFDMENDPAETTDLFAQHPAIVADLRRELERLKDEN